MTKLSTAQMKKMLRVAAKREPNASNLASVIEALDRFGDETGLNIPHRFVQYGAQLGHESWDFAFDKELWGPTAAQKRYEGRKDLGNLYKGDGYRFRGRGPIQITGRYNYRKFTKWAHKLDKSAPDFEANPDLVNTDPWEGLVPIWYWQTNSLNVLADKGDTVAITRRINGGKNGLADRLDRVTRLSLVALRYGVTEIKSFQRYNGLVDDGIAGPVTRSALHQSLLGMI